MDFRGPVNLDRGINYIFIFTHFDLKFCISIMNVGNKHDSETGSIGFPGLPKWFRMQKKFPNP